MKKNTLLFLLTYCSIFIPAPAYVGYGIILILGLNIIFSVCIGFSAYVNTLENAYKFPLLLIVATIMTLLYNQAITFFSPIIALNLGFILYLIPLSIVAFDTFIGKSTETKTEKVKESFKILALISVVSIAIFILREFLAFGTVSYPSNFGIVTIQLPIKIFENQAFFWSSIPGALTILTVFIVVLPILFTKEKKHTHEENI